MNTDTLIDLLGKNIAAPDVAKRLADYPALRPEEGGPSPTRAWCRDADRLRADRGLELTRLP